MFWSREKGEVIQLDVEGMHCTQCEATVKIALHKKPGVRRITIRQRQQVSVELAPGARITREELAAVIDATGYRVR